MRAYGSKRTRTTIAGHQRCGICHPPARSVAAARRVRIDATAARDELWTDAWIAADIEQEVRELREWGAL